MSKWTRQGPWLLCDMSEWQLRILIGEQHFTGLVDVELVAPNGQRFTGTIGTQGMIDEIMKAYQSTGECLNGRYFWCISLIVVDHLDEQTIYDVVQDLIRSGEIFSAFALVPEAEAAR